MKLKHYTIPVFIPEVACPFQCIYCNQRNISDRLREPTEEEIIETIEQHLITIPKENSCIEFGFFGGNFTGIEMEKQEKYLKLVYPYIQKKIIQGVRLSTRPDYINKDILELLKSYHVTTIELGAQSIDEEVLQLSGRGHTVHNIEEASSLIIQNGISLGLQMMIGLPGDTLEKAIVTANKIVKLGANNTRIYPTLVIKDTELEKRYHQKKYTPLTMEKAVDWTKEVYKIFENANVTVLRMGLHPSKGLITGETLIAGPFHVSFGELVMTAIWKEKLIPISGNGKNTIIISVPPGELNNAIGYNASNKKMLQNNFKIVKFKTDLSLSRRDFYVDYC